MALALMKEDGRSLEALVRQIEELLAPSDFVVRSNDKVYDDDGNQIAEFDIEVIGSFGSTQMRWLIECRDRKGSGSAPGSWIEQLHGRKVRFGYNKVTAVSASGFSPSAINAGGLLGIELRTVGKIGIDDIRSWLELREMTHYARYARVDQLEGTS